MRSDREESARESDVAAVSGGARQLRARLDERWDCARQLDVGGPRHLTPDSDPRRTVRTIRTGRHGFWCAGGAQRTIRKRRRPRSAGFPSRIAAFSVGETGI
jgi:hypothetical protein